MCSLHVAFMFAAGCNRSQPFATVRVRAVWPCLVVNSAKGVILKDFRRRVASFRLAGVALRDIQKSFVTCRMSFCVASAILLRRFRKMSCSFRDGRRTLDASIVILRGRRSTLDVSCCVFLRIALSGLRQVATRCKFRGRRDIL